MFTVKKYKVTRHKRCQEENEFLKETNRKFFMMLNYAISSMKNLTVWPPENPPAFYLAPWEIDTNGHLGD